MNRRISASLLRLTLVALGLVLSAGSAFARTVSATYTNPDLSVTVTTNGSEPYDRIDVPCKCTDKVGAGGITAAAPWTATSIVNNNGSCFVRLTRNASTDVTEKVTVTHPAGLARGKQGTISVSLAGANSGSGGTQTMLSVAAPGLGVGGTVTLILLLVAAGAFMLQRRRKTAAIA